MYTSILDIVTHGDRLICTMPHMRKCFHAGDATAEKVNRRYFFYLNMDKQVLFKTERKKGSDSMLSH